MYSSLLLCGVSKEKLEMQTSVMNFFNEIKSFMDDELKEEIAKQLTENYEEKRKKGESESHICELIRDDMIDEFISFVNQNIHLIISNI